MALLGANISDFEILVCSQSDDLIDAYFSYSFDILANS